MGYRLLWVYFAAGNCPALSAPVGGFIENKTACQDGSADIGTTCEFSCALSQRLVGDKVLICDAGWSASPPTCVSKLTT